MKNSKRLSPAMFAAAAIVISLSVIACANNDEEKLKGAAQLETMTNTIFPKGNPAPAEYFTGTVSVQTLVPDDSTFQTVISSVTFEAGARTNWHTHPSGQILLVTAGSGLYQEKGEAVQQLDKGDVVKFLPNVEHWHGASPNSAMTHVAINPNTENGIVEWLQAVTSREYEQSQ